VSEYEHNEHLLDEIQRLRESNFHLRKDCEEQKQRIAQLEHEIELFREHADYEDVCLVEAILKGEEIGRKENQQ
jgi:predicted RNase H-like nuclease (RuvC/YqgF family)